MKIPPPGGEQWSRPPIFVVPLHLQLRFGGSMDSEKVHRMGGAPPMGDRVSCQVFGRKIVLDKRTRPPVSFGPRLDQFDRALILKISTPKPAILKDPNPQSPSLPDASRRLCSADRSGNSPCKSNTIVLLIPEAASSYPERFCVRIPGN